jgi:hypothetical protein
MKKKLIIISLLISIFLTFSCKKNIDNEPEVTSYTADISGYVQKGPFINGTNITIIELNEDLTQTGNTFFTQIINNSGAFELNDLSLVSNYISINADGFYFNEIIAEQSNSQITLHVLSDISDRSTINVNVLTHLEKPRIEHLVSQGVSFNVAKKQALSEVLAIFNISKDSISESELFDISKAGDENAILLATSLILQGFRTEGEFTELLSFISLDIKSDGELNDSLLGSQLINHAVYLDTATITNNLINRYSELGLEFENPNFSKYIFNFIDNTPFEITDLLIKYPTTGVYGENILDLNKTHFLAGEVGYSIATDLSNNLSVKIKLTTISGQGIGHYLGSNINWIIQWPYLISNISGESCDLKTDALFPNTEILIEYFETSSPIPTRSKVIYFD